MVGDGKVGVGANGEEENGNRSAAVSLPIWRKSYITHQKCKRAYRS